MKLSVLQNYFLALFLIAVILLWGVSLWNGTVKMMLLTTWYERFEDGSQLRTNYTGIYILDFPLSLLIAFFFHATSVADPGYQLFLIDAYSTLQSAFVWLYVESNRANAKPYAVAK